MLTHRLKYDLHISEEQGQGAKIAVVNILFDRNEFGESKWFKDEHEVDSNTVPAPININWTEPYIEAMILAGTVTEIMTSDSKYYDIFQ